ncbi:MAG: DUF6778 family protein, partial [Pseudorhodobacter sp.]
MLAQLHTGRRLFVASLVSFGLAGCVADFETSYDESAPATARQNWGSPTVRVSLAKGLTTTEQNSFIPNADVVWHGDPKGDRPAQAAAVVKTGVEKG